MAKTFKNVGEGITIELCQMYYILGFNCIWTDGNDLTLEEKEKDLTSGN